MSRILPGGRALALLLVAACPGGEQPASGGGLPETLLSPEGAHHTMARFSPDGKRVAYWAASPNGWELRVAAADLSGSRVLATAEERYDPILWSPDGQQLAYASNAASFADVWVVSADSGAPRRLTTAPGSEFALQWHPKGGRLAYSATEEGGVLRSNVVDLATGKTSPMLEEKRSSLGFWSPDGSRIAYQVIEGSKATIWLADSAGGNPKALTAEGLESFEGSGSPWSPDGKEVLYVSRRTGHSDIWALPVDGGVARQLTTDVRDDGNPAWSPDGKWIAFVSDRGRQTDVWVMPAAGGQEVRVTDDEARENAVQWVGAGSIGFQTGRTNGVLSLISAADGSERKLTPDSLQITTFDIAPDGQSVVYGVTRGGGVSEVEVVPIAGGAAKTIVTGQADNGDPYWSPDGRHVLFFSNRSGSGDLWVVDAAGGEPRALTTWPTDEVDGEWAADSKSVYFLSGRFGGAFFDLYQVPVTGGEPKRLTTTGSVINVEPGRGSGEVFITGLGKKAGQIVLSRVASDGSQQMLWDRSNVQGLSHRRISPSGDSLLVQVEQPGGGFASMVVSVQGHGATTILSREQSPGPWSPDGKAILYYFGNPAADLGIFTFADGATRRLTNTPESEGSTQWTPDSKSIVVLRTLPRRRIATVEVRTLLAH